MRGINRAPFFSNSFVVTLNAFSEASHKDNPPRRTAEQEFKQLITNTTFTPSRSEITPSRPESASIQVYFLE